MYPLDGACAVATVSLIVTSITLVLVNQARTNRPSQALITGSWRFIARVPATRSCLNPKTAIGDGCHGNASNKDYRDVCSFDIFSHRFVIWFSFCFGAWDFEACKRGMPQPHRTALPMFQYVLPSLCFQKSFCSSQPAQF